MSERKYSADYWAAYISSVIKRAEADGWQVGIGEDGDREQYVLEVYTYDDLTNHAEVDW